MFPGSGISPPPLHDLTCYESCNGSTPRLALYIHGWEDALEILQWTWKEWGSNSLYPFTSLYALYSSIIFCRINSLDSGTASGVVKAK